MCLSPPPPCPHQHHHLHVEAEQGSLLPPLLAPRQSQSQPQQTRGQMGHQNLFCSLGRSPSASALSYSSQSLVCFTHLKSHCHLV